VFSLRYQQILLAIALVLASAFSLFAMVDWALRTDDGQQQFTKLEIIRASAAQWLAQHLDILNAKANQWAQSHWLHQQLAIPGRDTSATLLAAEDLPVGHAGDFLFVHSNGGILAVGQNLYPLLRGSELLARVQRGETQHGVISNETTTWLVSGVPTAQSVAPGGLFAVKMLDTDFFTTLAQATGSTVALPRPGGAPIVAVPPGPMQPPVLTAESVEPLLQLQADHPAQWRHHGQTWWVTRVSSPSAPTLLLLSPRAEGYQRWLWAMRFAAVSGLWLLIAGAVMYWVTVPWLRNLAMLYTVAEQAGRDHYDFRVRIGGHNEFSQFGEAFNQMLQEFAEKEQLREAMEKIVSKQIAYEILQGGVNLEGEERQASVLTADLHGFSRVSANLKPNELLELLNNYFTRMSFCIDARNGTIDKYLGDAFMALFGVPARVDDDALAAVLAAQDILTALELFNLEVGQYKDKHFSVGIGIHSGSLVAGNIGADDRLNYSVIGEAVNLSARIQGLTKLYNTPILASGDTMDRIKLQSVATLQTGVIFQARQVDVVHLKDHAEGMPIWEIFPRNACPFSVDSLQLFEQARNLAMEQQFKPALERFEQLLAFLPEDGPSRLWVERCQRYALNSSAFKADYPHGAFGRGHLAANDCPPLE